MRVIVSGARGFIGSALCASLRSVGHEVVPLSLRVHTIPSIDADLAIHLAHDRSTDGQKRLISWYKELEARWRGQTDRQIYVSSYSARADALSVYGRTKYAIENLFLEQGHGVTRPGLVLGRGGIFGAMTRVIRHSPIVPVPGGRARVPYVSLSRLCTHLAGLPEGIHNLFSTDLVGLAKLVETSCLVMEVRRVVLSLPAAPCLWALKGAESMRVKLPVTSDSLIGLMVNQEAVHFSTSGYEPLETALADLRGLS